MKNSGTCAPDAMRVFGVSIEGEPLERIREHVIGKPRAWGAFWIVTANPEILLEARRDETYAEILRQADLRVVDGFGLWLMLRLCGFRSSRVSGVELAEDLIATAAEKRWRVALVGGTDGVAAKAALEWKKRFPELDIFAEQGGVVLRDGTDDATGEEARHRLTFFAPHVLLVAFGHPKQERWIARHLADFPGVKVAVGIGGAMDFWAGKAKRAPRFLRHLGLEWLWRFAWEPRRIRRMWNAVAVFSFAFLFDRIKET